MMQEKVTEVLAIKLPAPPTPPPPLPMAPPALLTAPPTLPSPLPTALPTPPPVILISMALVYLLSLP